MRPSLTVVVLRYGHIAGFPMKNADSSSVGVESSRCSSVVSTRIVASCGVEVRKGLVFACSFVVVLIRVRRRVDRPLSSR